MVRKISDTLTPQYKLRFYADFTNIFIREKLNSEILVFKEHENHFINKTIFLIFVMGGQSD